MQMQLTDYAVALLNSSTGPITLTNGKLGSAVNYIPLPTDTDIHGTTIFEMPPSAPVAVAATGEV